MKLNTVGLMATTLLMALTLPLGLRLVPGGFSFSSSKAEAASTLLEVQESLSDDDRMVEFEQGNRRVDVHRFNGSSGQSVAINLASTDFDTVVMLVDAEGEVIDGNDDISPENLNSRLELDLPTDGTYGVIVTSVEFEGRGRYQLTVVADS